MTMRSQNRVLVGDLRTHWHQLTDLCAGHNCRDGIEGTSNFFGSIGLHIPHVDMTGAALQQEKDARFGFRSEWGRGLSLQLQQHGKRQSSQQPSRSQRQHSSP